MRTVWFRGGAMAGAGLLAVVMLLINYAFEAAGSVPDLEGCGFLAGSLASLAVLYPLAAAAVAGWTLRPLARRFAIDPSRVVRYGGRIGAAGALTYFVAGLGLAGGRSSSPLSLAVWPAMGAFTLLCWMGGRLGAFRVLRAEAAVSLQEGGG